MAYKIEEVEGIGPSYGAKLKEAGIDDTDDFLKLCCDAKGRKEAAEKTGISEKMLLTWANMADLMRVNGVGKQYAEILHAAGVDTIRATHPQRCESHGSNEESKRRKKSS